MKHKLRLLWYYAETRYVKLLRIFGVRRSTDYIPDGMYCYVWDDLFVGSGSPCLWQRIG